MRKILALSLVLTFIVSFAFAGGVGAAPPEQGASLESRVSTLEVQVADLEEDADAVRVELAELDARVDALASSDAGGDAPALPAVQMFLAMEGVPGESRDRDHAGEIDVLSWSWGAAAAIVTGGDFSRNRGRFDVQEFSFTHHVDKASPVLFLRCATGQHIPEATFTVRTAGPEGSDYLVIKLTDVMVSSVAPGGGSAGPTEAVTLNFAKVEMEYRAQRADGSADTPVRAGWDLVQNRAV